MCYGCYEGYGNPTIVNEITKAAAALIARIYEYDPTGGNLHIVVDDWNLDDGSIANCIEAIASGGWEGRGDPIQLRVESECAEMLKRMTTAQRASALAIHDNYLELDDPNP